MKKLFALNNKTIVSLLYLLLVFDIASVVLLTAHVYARYSVKVSTVKRQLDQGTYHRLMWDEYGPEIEQAVLEPLSKDAVTLSHVYGGIVSHHIPTTIKEIVALYRRLGQHEEVKNFIIIGPDHTDAGSAPITVSNARFITTYGEVQGVDTLPFALKRAKLANIEEAPFSKEHSVGSQVLIISKLFPHAKVTPIILRSDTSKDQAEALGVFLSSFIDEKTVIIASVDFSHYLASNQAHALDKVSEHVIKNLDIEASPLVKADSGKSMVVFMKAMSSLKATKTDSLSVLNTNDLMQNNDYTTGYVFGLWGVEKNNENVVPTAKDDMKATSSSIIFVGDIMLSRFIGTKMSQKSDWTFPFAESATFLKDADLTFGNLEGPITERGTKMGSLYSFRANKKSVEGLTYAGFDVVSVANNHIFDYGNDGITDTLDILKTNGMSYVGGGKDYNEAHSAVVKEINGTKVAFLGYTNLLPSFLGKSGAVPSIASYDTTQLRDDIKNAKSKADIVIVSFHFGTEYELKHNGFQEAAAHTAIDAGADLVVGHHPHVVQDIEKYKNKYIVYSMGNFVFDQNFSEDTRKGLAVKAIISNKKIERIETYDVNFNSAYQPFVTPNNKLLP
jgi:poly-gamma-glutamate synthesis protein (capsule biosynthesis protein)